jgi:hypothetical protein
LVDGGQCSAGHAVQIARQMPLHDAGHPAVSARVNSDMQHVHGQYLPGLDREHGRV